MTQGHETVDVDELVAGLGRREFHTLTMRYVLGVSEAPYGVATPKPAGSTYPSFAAQYRRLRARFWLVLAAWPLVLGSFLALPAWEKLHVFLFVFMWIATLFHIVRLGLALRDALSLPPH
jgi:hypothetical protein